MSNTPPNVTSWLPNLLGPVFFLVNGVASTAPRRQTLNIVGDVTITDDPDNDRTNIVVTPSTLAGDSGGVAHIAASEVDADGDNFTQIASKCGHHTTTTDTVEHVTLFTLLGIERRRVDIVVTAINSDGSKGGTWTIRAQLRRTGGVSTLLSGGTDPAPDSANTASLDVSVDLSTNNLRLNMTGLTGERFTWGWEIRSQRQNYEP